MPPVVISIADQARTTHATASMLWLAASLGLTAIAGGCTKHATTREIDLETPKVATTLPGAPSGPALDIENFRGTVEIRVRAHEDDVDITAHVRAAADMPDEQVKALAQDVAVEATVEDRGGLPVVVVRTRSARAGEAQDHFVELHIDMPACSGVRVRNAGGLVKIIGAAGAVQVENDDGPIEVRTRHVLTAPIALTTSSGGVYCLVPRGSTGAIDLRTDDGNASFEGPDQPLTRVTGGGGTLKAVLNGGENPVMLRTGSGTVKFGVIADPEGRTRTWH